MYTTYKEKFVAFLYGFAGVRQSRHVIRYVGLTVSDMSVRDIREAANRLREDFPEIKEVFLVDNRYGLRRDYLEAVKGLSGKNPIESSIEFYEIISKEGLKII